MTDAVTRSGGIHQDEGMMPRPWHRVTHCRLAQAEIFPGTRHCAGSGSTGVRTSRTPALQRCGHRLGLRLRRTYFTPFRPALGRGPLGTALPGFKAHAQGESRHPLDCLKSALSVLARVTLRRCRGGAGVPRCPGFRRRSSGGRRWWSCRPYAAVRCANPKIGSGPSLKSRPGASRRHLPGTQPVPEQPRRSPRSNS